MRLIQALQSNNVLCQIDAKVYDSNKNLPLQLGSHVPQTAT
jgi:hypothetical protein